MTTDPKKSGKANITPAEFVEKLKRALAKDGDFPASGKVVNELLRRASERNVTANQISAIVLKEQSLSARILHVVNSSFYSPGKPIMTVSNAVVRLGLKNVVELCSGLVLLQKFVPAARAEGPFADCLKQAVLTSIIARNLEAEIAKHEERSASETGYLAGCFAALGLLLTGYYFPALYKSSVTRSQEEPEELDTTISRVTGYTPFQLSKHALASLSLPEMYDTILDAADRFLRPNMHVEAAEAPKALSRDTETLAKVVACAHALAGTIVYGKTRQDLESCLKSLEERCGVERTVFQSLLTRLTEDYTDHCISLEIPPTPMPDFVLGYTAPGSGIEVAGEEDSSYTDDEEFLAYKNEMSEAIKDNEPAVSIVLTAMEILAWGLKFDRVLLLLPGPTMRKLNGAMFLGASENFDPTRMTRALELPPSPANPDITAFKESRVVNEGLALLPGAQAFAILPVGYGDRAVGVIYADRNRPGSAAVTPTEVARLKVLSDLLDHAVLARSTMLQDLALASNNLRLRRSDWDNY